MKRKNLGRAVLVLFLLLPALAVWWPLWFMGTGALMPLDELRAALGPVLQLSLIHISEPTRPY